MDALTKTIHDRVIDPLTRQDVYDYYGIGTVNGVLFHGPPGCGRRSSRARSRPKRSTTTSR